MDKLVQEREEEIFFAFAAKFALDFAKNTKAVLRKKKPSNEMAQRSK
jgi:hypothetical protein